MKRPTWIRAVCLAALLLAAGGTAHAQIDDVARDVTKTGTTAAAFLGIPVGARATAMGGAVSASVDDGTAVYWNPAGLASLSAGTFTGEHAEWLAGVSMNYVSVALPTGVGTFGLAATFLRTPEMDVTTEEQQDGTGETFDASSYALVASYARPLTDRFQIGANAKLITETISNSSAHGVALDVGTLFTTPWGVRLGASIANFGTKMRMAGDDLLVPVDVAPGQEGNNESTRGEITTDAFDLPLTMRIGLAGEVYRTPRSRLTLAVDALNPNDNAQYVNLGAELALMGELLRIRAGYNELFLDDSVRSFATGAGLRYGFGSLHFTLDYAFEAQKYFDGVNRLTLALEF